jgi:histone H3/H4
MRGSKMDETTEAQPVKRDRKRRLKLIIASFLPRYMNSMKISKDFGPALDAKVIMLIEEAKLRAEANGRNTVMGKDI